MGQHDHYIFMDGCVVKGCHPHIDFERTFGEYAALLRDLYDQGGWGPDPRRGLRRLLPTGTDWHRWVQTHVHTGQSTENKRTGAGRVHDLLATIPGSAHIHLFGTSAAGVAMLEYFLLCDPATLYYRSTDEDRLFCSDRRYDYDIDPRIASLTLIDAPTNWVPLRRTKGPFRRDYGQRALGQWLPAHTRLRTGPGVPVVLHTVRLEDVPDTWVGATPIADLDYDNNPHYDGLPALGMERHIYSGSHMSRESHAFLRRVWR